MTRQEYKQSLINDGVPEDVAEYETKKWEDMWKKRDRDMQNTPRLD